jgi:single-strand DNA-binding protein
MLNKACIIGNLGRDPEVRSFSNGSSVANFRVATSKRWKDKETGENKDKTEWHHVSVFSPGLISVCQNFLQKGSLVYIEGEIQTRKWQDKDGNDRYTTEILANNIQMINGIKNKSSETSSDQSTSYDNDFALDDDIPF